ncbi:MAG: oxidative damage protection protein [Arenicellales bacterium WSBS_2016_MAG_OTU3]
MTRTVQCVVLKQEAEGLGKPPYPGELGQRIFETVSAEGWKQWLERLVTIINELQLSTADESSRELIEDHMKGFLFGEGEKGQLPPGFNAPRKK